MRVTRVRNRPHAGAPCPSCARRGDRDARDRFAQPDITIDFDAYGSRGTEGIDTPQNLTALGERGALSAARVPALELGFGVTSRVASRPAPVGRRWRAADARDFPTTRH